MKAQRLIFTAMVLGGILLTGCQKVSVTTPEGTTLQYNLDKSDPTGPDPLNTSSATAPKTKLTADQEKWAKAYDDQEAKKAAAKVAQAKAVAAKRAAAQNAAKENAANKEIVDFINSIKGSVKKGAKGAIVGVTLAASSASASDQPTDAPADGEEEKVAPAVNLTAEDMAKIAQLPDVETISLEGSAFNDETCAPLAKMKKLKSVTVNNANIQDQTLEMLATLPELTYLDIRRDLKLNNASLEILQKMPKLTELHAHYNSFTNSGVNKISKVQTLKVVDVRGCSDVSDNSAKYLAKLPELEQVYFRFMISNEGIGYLANAPKLKFAEFQDCNGINAESVDSFLKMPALTGLRFFRCKGIDDATIQGIAQRPLERIELRDLNLSNEGIAPLKNQTGLKTIELSELASVDAAGLTDLLSSLKGIDRITFFAIDLNDEGVAKLVENNPDLTNFAARAVVVSDAAIDSILKLSKLTSLDLRSNSGISADALLKLKALTGLKTLYLKDTQIVAKGNEAKLAELKAALPKCRFVE